MRSLVAAMLCVLSVPAMAESGIASVYGNGDGYAWRCTANWRAGKCERMNPAAMTAAHRTLPLGTMVAVTNRRNGNSVLVRINDRGPFIAGRIIDLTPAADRALDCRGLCTVTLQ